MSTRIKTGTAMAVVVAAVALPGAALAGGSNYSGPVKETPQGSVKFKIKGKKVEKVTNVSALFIPAQCSGDNNPEIDVNPQGSAKVEKNKFHFKASSAFDSFVFDGKLRKQGKLATGTLRYKGFVSVDGSPEGCDTGTLRWSAER